MKRPLLFRFLLTRKKFEQGTREWEQFRSTLFITGSEIAPLTGRSYDVVKEGTVGKGGKITEQQAKVRWLKEKMGLVKKSVAPQVFLDHGKRHEPDAREAFLEAYPQFRKNIFDIGCVSLGEVHGGNMYDRWENHVIGGSPDAIVYDEKTGELSVVEFKCPYNRKWNPRAKDSIPLYNMDQILFYMLLTGVNSGYYVEYYCSKNHIIEHRVPKIRIVKTVASSNLMVEQYNILIRATNEFVNLAENGPALKKLGEERMKEMKDK